METSKSAPKFVCCSVEICFDSKTVAMAGQPVSVTPLEFSLLAYLAEHGQRAVSADELLQEVWECDQGGTPNQVRSAIKRLRKKLGENEESPAVLHTIYGWGWRLCAPSDAPPAQSRSKTDTRLTHR
jgi:DNA-binding response OmpR family regulator